MAIKDLTFLPETRLKQFIPGQVFLLTKEDTLDRQKQRIHEYDINSFKSIKHVTLWVPHFKYDVSVSLKTSATLISG